MAPKQQDSSHLSYEERALIDFAFSVVETASQMGDGYFCWGKIPGQAWLEMGREDALGNLSQVILDFPPTTPDTSGAGSPSSPSSDKT
jgi:hypothetical protein